MFYSLAQDETTSANCCRPATLLGHSMTIVGLEKQKNGSKNLLIFDPMFSDASGIVKLVGKKFEHRFPDKALKPYRRGSSYLKKYRAFEVLE